MSLFRLDASIRGRLPRPRHRRPGRARVAKRPPPGRADHSHPRADVWQLDVRVAGAEFTKVGVNPALDGFKDVAHRLRRETELHDHQLGRELAAVTAQRPPPE
jgi:hypothetical protein